jgi:hypothetical protein
VIVVNPTQDNIKFLEDNGVKFLENGQIDNTTLS